MQNYYGMSGMGWYDFARSRGFTGTPEQLMDIMVGNIAALMDHRALVNRDAEEQHPISAIAGLNDALNRLQDAKGDAASDHWRVVEIYPIQWATEVYDEIDATSERVEYFAMPDEIDINEGVWEAELVVLGLYGSGITTSGAVIHVALMDRQTGMDIDGTYCQPFAVSPTGSGKMTVRHHAILHADNYYAERDGYVQAQMTHDQSFYGDINTAEGVMMPVNTVAVSIAQKGTTLKTGGVYLRYRRIM